MNPTLDARVVAGIGRRLNLSAILFGLSIPLALLSTTLTYLLWIGTFVLLFTTDWLSWQQAIKTEHAYIPLEGARRAHLRVEHWRRQLNIDAHPATDLLIQGVFGGGLDRKISRSGEVIDVLLRSAGHARSFMSLKFPWTWGAWGPASLLDWTFRLSQQIPIVLDVALSNGQASLELGELQITELNIVSHASSMLISLPVHAGQTMVNIQASTLSLILRVPTEVGAHIQTNQVQATAEIDPTRFPMMKQAGEYRSVNYDTAANRVDIHIEYAGGSVEIV